MRPTWDDVWMTVAEDISARSLCVRSRVGAVIVDSRNRIVASGYNNPPAGFEHRNEPCIGWCERGQGKNYHLKMTTQHGDSETTVHLGEVAFYDGRLFHKDELGVTGEEITEQELLDAGYEKEYDLAPDYSDCPSLHAEANALMTADRSTWEYGTIYVTSDVCFPCAKLIANSGLGRVVVKSDPVREYRNPGPTYNFLRRCDLVVEMF